MNSLQTAQQRSQIAQEQDFVQQEATTRGHVADQLAAQQRIEFRLSAIEAAQIAKTAETINRRNSRLSWNTNTLRVDPPTTSATHVAVPTIVV